MSQESTCNNTASEAEKPAISTAAILFDGFLPAGYLNEFNIEAPVAKVSLLDRVTIRVGETIAELDEYQVLALNALTICIDRAVPVRRLSEVSTNTGRQMNPYTMGRSMSQLKRIFEEAVELPLFTVSHEKNTRTYRLAPLHFIQEGTPDTNGLFNRLTDIGRAKFGRRVWSMFLLDQQVVRQKVSQVPEVSVLELMQYGESGNLRLHGACDEESADLFFPDPRHKRQIEKAKSICRSCPVATRCLAEGLELNEHGIWGGQTEKERRRKPRSLAHLGIIEI